MVRATGQYITKPMQGGQAPRMARLHKGEKIMSQNSDILHYLQKHPEGITPRDAYRKFGCFRLSARIFELRKMGHKISAMTKVEHTDTGTVQNFALYRLVDSANGLDL